MNSEIFKKWKLACFAVSFTLLGGFLITIYLPAYEGIGLSFAIPAYFIAIFISTRINFDNRSLWFGMALLLPYIALPITLLRGYEGVKRNEKKIWNKTIDNIEKQIEKYVLLLNKSTMRSLISGGNIFRKIADDPANWNPLCALVFDKNRKIEIRVEGIKILFDIEDSHIANDVIAQLSNDENPIIRKTIHELEQENIEEEDLEEETEKIVGE